MLNNIRTQYADNEPRVSIVIPIYNVERYLRQCVDSILGQTLKDIEIILVDDGSPDGCPAIVDEYAAKDPRVVAIHQTNGGYGKAVNHGISTARAPYIGIIESDDWIEPNMYEKLYNRAVKTGAEVVKCAFYVYDSTKPENCQDQPYDESEAVLMKAPDGVFRPTEWDRIFTYHASIWSNLYKADFLKQIPLIETQGASYQDFPFFMEVLVRAKSMSIVKEYLLHYRMETGQGSSTTRRDKGLLRMVDMTETAREVLQKYGMLEKLKEAFYFHAFLTNYAFSVNIAPQYRNEYFRRLHELFKPVKADPTFRFTYFSDHYKTHFILCMNGRRNRYYHKVNISKWRKFRRRIIRIKIRKDAFMFKLFGFGFCLGSKRPNW